MNYIIKDGKWNTMAGGLQDQAWIDEYYKCIAGDGGEVLELKCYELKRETQGFPTFLVSANWRGDQIHQFYAENPPDLLLIVEFCKKMMGLSEFEWRDHFLSRSIHYKTADGKMKWDRAWFENLGEIIDDFSEALARNMSAYRE